MSVISTTSHAVVQQKQTTELALALDRYGSTNFMNDWGTSLCVLLWSADTELSNYDDMFLHALGVLFDDIPMCISLCPEVASSVQKDKKCALVCGKEALPECIPSSV